MLNSQHFCRQTKGLKEAEGFCRNVWLLEQSCILECIIGNCSFPNTVAASTLWQEPRVFVSLTAELFPCSDSSTAVSIWVKAAALCSTSLTLPGETHREANFTLQVALVLQSSAPSEPCLMWSSGYDHSMSTHVAPGCSDTTNGTPQMVTVSKFAFPKEAGVSLRVNLRTIHCATWWLSALSIPILSAAFISLPHFICKHAQRKKLQAVVGALLLDPEVLVEEVAASAPPRCLSKQLSLQTSKMWAVLASHCPGMPVQGSSNCCFFHFPSKNSSYIVLPCTVLYCISLYCG